MRRFILSALLLGTGLSASLFTPSAHAQRTVNLNPKTTDWAVKQIASNVNALDSYCAVAREFPRSTILTFAKNNKSEASIALDFQREVFNTTRFFSMTIDAGHNESRSFEVRPVSEKGFVVRLGRDDPFFSALLRSREMAVSLDNRVYNFNLADIEKGQYELDTCLAAITMPAAGEETPGRPQVVQGKKIEPPPQTTGFEQASSRMREGQLREELAVMREENASLRRQLTKKVIPAQKKSSGAGDTIINLSGKNALLELEIDRLRTQLTRAENEEKFRDDAMSRELMRLRTENAVLQADLEASRTNASDETVMDKRFAALTKERDHLSDMLKKANSNFQVLSEAAALHKTEHGKMQEENESLRRNLSRGQKQLEDMQSSLEREQEEITHLRNRVNDLQASNANLQQQRLSALGGAKKEENTKIIDGLKEENAALLSSLDEMRRAEDQFASAQQTLENLRAENKLLVARLADLETATGGESSSVVLAQLEHDKDLLEQENGSLERQKSSLEQEVRSLQKENQILADAQSQTPQQPAMDSAAQAELAELKSQNTQLNQQIQNLRQQISQSNTQNTQLQQRITSLENSNRELNQTQANLEQMRQDLEVSKQELERSQQSLSESLLAAETTAEEKDTQIARLRSRLNRVEERKSDLMGSLAVKGARPKPLAPAAHAAVSEASQLDKTVALLNAGVSSQGPSERVRASIDREEIAAAPEDVTSLSRDELRQRQAERQRAYEQIERQILNGAERFESSPAQRQERALSDTIMKLANEDAVQAESKPQQLRRDAVETVPAGGPNLAQRNDVQSGETQPSEIVQQAKAEVAEMLQQKAPEEQKKNKQAPQSIATAPQQPRFRFDPSKFKRPAGMTPAGNVANTPSLGGSYQIADLLQRSGVPVSQAPKRVSSQDGRVLHQWKTRDVFGSSEQRPINDMAEFENGIQDFLKLSRGRCQGAFSVIPAARLKVGSERLSGYELNCQTQGQTMAASLLFFSKQGTFNVIAHEARPERMSTAVDARDKIMRFLRGVES